MSKHDEIITISTPEGEITTNKALLNHICEAFCALYNEDKSCGYNTCAKKEFEMIGNIFNSLNETGYYDDVKGE